MPDNEILGRLEKQNEGITLGLGALAEVLQKMESRLQKQDELTDAQAAEAEEETEEEQLEEMYKSLVKDVSKSVTRQIGRGRRIQKQDNPMAELNENKSKKVSGTGWPMSSRSKASIEESGEDTLNSSTTDSVQMPIEAMEKMIKKAAASLLKKGGYGRVRKQGEEEVVEEEAEEELVEGMKDQHENGNGEEEMYPVEEQDEEGAVDEPILEDDEEGTNVQAMVRNMQKQITSLKTQNTSLSKGMEKKVRNETETRLRKMGFREEKGLAGVKQSTAKLGAQEPLIKSAKSGNEVVDQLAGLSWNELNEMRFKIEQGDTDGIPRELLSN